MNHLGLSFFLFIDKIQINFINFAKQSNDNEIHNKR